MATVLPLRVSTVKRVLPASLAVIRAVTIMSSVTVTTARRNGGNMIRWISLLVALLLYTTFCIPAAVTPALQIVDSFTHPVVAASGFATPRWHNGYLAYFSVDFPPEIKLVKASTGELMTTKNIAFPTAPYVRIRNVAVSNTGRIAYSAIGRDGQGRGVLLIGWIAASGAPEFVVRTDKFAAEHLSFAPDGTLWVIGRTNKIDLLAHFDSAGRQIMPYIEFPRGPKGTMSNFLPQQVSMVSIADRVGILRDGKGVWTEVSNDGQMLGEWPLPKRPIRGSTGIAFTSSGNVYISLDEAQDARGAADVHLLNLRKDTGEWSDVPYDILLASGAPHYIYLHGARGEDLVIDTGPKNDLRVVRLDGN